VTSRRDDLAVAPGTDRSTTPDPARPRAVAEAGFMGLFLVGAALWNDHPWLMLAIVAAILALRFAAIGRRHDLRYLVLGVLLGGGNDLMSIIRGVYAYTVPHPLVPWPIPLWMILFWGQVFLLMRTVFDLPWLRGPGASRGLWPPGWHLLVDLAGVVVMRLVVYATFTDPVLPALALSAVGILTYAAHGITRTDLKVMAVTAVAGPIVEWALISAGVYDYRNPFLLGMPAWLYVWWLYATPLLKRIFDRMEWEPAE